MALLDKTFPLCQDVTEDDTEPHTESQAAVSSQGGGNGLVKGAQVQEEFTIQTRTFGPRA